MSDDDSVMQNPDWIQPGLSPAQIDTLLKPLNKTRVAHRQQAGQQLSYLEQHEQCPART